MGAAVVSKRERVARLLDRAGLFEAVLRLRARARSPWLTILTYHRVEEPSRERALDTDVIDVTPDEFDAQLRVLKRWFDVVRLDEVRAFFRGGAKLPANPALITFDDGYRACHDVAMPILAAHGLPATVFVATAYLEDRRLYWWDRISWLVKRAGPRVVELDYPMPLRIDLGATGVRALLRLVKDHRGLDLDLFLERLAAALDVAWEPELERRLADDVVMTWDHAREMCRAGIDIQSHTRTHRVLQTLSPAQLAAELAGSRADIERELHRPVYAIAYPGGRTITDDITKAVATAGYDLGFSNKTGATNLWGERDPLHLRRVSLEHDLGASLFRGILAMPFLAPEDE
jgi:peptidoglycan/xylan/chitin deacetylase (PgdA/CDA1 family)